MSNCDKRILFLREEEMFIILSIVLDDLGFASNFNSFINYFKDKLSATLDVKFF